MTNLSGGISWFGGPHDSMAGGAPASGISINVPGVAVYNHATLGGYWLVHMPNGRQAVLQQTDIGPAPSTNRVMDFTFSALPHLGYSEGNFPTDGHITATYLGKTVPKQYASLAVAHGGTAAQGQQPAASSSASPTTGQAMTSSTAVAAPDWGSAILGAMAKARPIDMTGKLHSNNVLSDAIHTVQYQQAQAALQALAPAGTTVLPHPAAAH